MCHWAPADVTGQLCGMFSLLQPLSGLQRAQIARLVWQQLTYAAVLQDPQQSPHSIPEYDSTEECSLLGFVSSFLRQFLNMKVLYFSFTFMAHWGFVKGVLVALKRKCWKQKGFR